MLADGFWKVPNYQLSLTTLEVTELLLSLLPIICHQHQWLTSVLWILLYCNWLIYATDCHSIFSQWLANINVLPTTDQSCSTDGDRVRPQIAIDLLTMIGQHQCFTNDWPILLHPRAGKYIVTQLQSSPNDRPISIDCKWANDREEVDDLRVDCEIAGRSLGKHWR